MWKTETDFYTQKKIKNKVNELGGGIMAKNSEIQKIRRRIQSYLINVLCVYFIKWRSILQRELLKPVSGVESVNSIHKKRSLVFSSREICFNYAGWFFLLLEHKTECIGCTTQSEQTAYERFMHIFSGLR